MRLIVCRCEVTYSGRLSALLPEALRLVMVKADGSVLVHADTGGFRPLNWMASPTVIEEAADRMIVRKQTGRTEERLEIGISEVVSDTVHVMDADAAELEKSGAERDLQELLAARPEAISDGLVLVRREWPTDIGPVDLMCRDHSGAYVAVEVKRVAGIPAVEQLVRYLERIRAEDGLPACEGILCAEHVKPQARVLCAERGLGWVEVDPALLRGEREPDLVLFERAA